MPILEKAWAKIHGCYENIQSGAPSEGLKALTGAPTDYHLHSKMSNPEQLWGIIESAMKNEYVACCSVHGGDIAHELSEQGMLADHAYAILSTHRV